MMLAYVEGRPTPCASSSLMKLASENLSTRNKIDGDEINTLTVFQEGALQKCSSLPRANMS